MRKTLIFVFECAAEDLCLIEESKSDEWISKIDGRTLLDITSHLTVSW